ncbi:MAG: glutamate synthase large subunit [Verrucomicrobiota bacterium]|nr:glutamate synthase large subunit [Verrucomicrobiota bacterium]
MSDNSVHGTGRPEAQGLYDPSFEHDSCGIGFVVNVKGTRTHDIVQMGLKILVNMDHRGACGCEPNTGDGAGILLQLPHEFFKAVLPSHNIHDLPEPGFYGAGLVFLPRDPILQRKCEETIERVVRECGQKFIGWRTVLTRNFELGATAVAYEPVVRQVFIGRSADVLDQLAFERKLYVIRRVCSHQLRYSNIKGGNVFYMPSLSSRTIIYKGMLTPGQVGNYYPDLNHPAMKSALALIHSRFSTNTFPSWERAQPFRYVSHNGEINTLRGNENWIHASQALFQSELFGDDLKKLIPIIRDDGSDSMKFDNVLEFLHLTGRSLPHSILMMIPEPWANHESMSDEKKAFYEFHACLMEPWDGPASMSFCDGTSIGAILDRNGLRPSRYYVTNDDFVIMASEAGVLDHIPPNTVVKKGRLQPGKMFLVDTVKGRIIDDEEIKNELATAHPYREWLNKGLVALNKLPEPKEVAGVDHKSVLQRQRAFGYSYEDQQFILNPMARDGVEPLGSMGTDIPVAVLSRRPQLMYAYFKQLFAQVTNPPIDAIREEIITSTICYLGSEANLLNPDAGSARQVKLEYPVLDNTELEKLRQINEPGFKSVTLSILFPAGGDGSDLEEAMEKLYALADEAIEGKANILILSDRGLDKKNAPIPALLAVSGLHHHLIRKGTRTKCALVLESGEPRETHHFALLIGYGVSAINPYLAFESIYDMIHEGLLDAKFDKAVKNYIKAGIKGVVKTMSKMGISTIQSYCGAQIFEAIGIKKTVVDKYFTWTSTRIEGIDLDGIAAEVNARHTKAFPDRDIGDQALDTGGIYAWRAGGEIHLFNPQTIHLLQLATRTGNYERFKDFSKLINDQAETIYTLRGLMEFKFDPEQEIPIEEVESVDTIVKRFKTGAMSYGSISKEAHEALAIAMNRLGGKSNTGEGGEDPARYVLEANGDSKNSAIKQVASGRFGVTSNYLVNAKELQIKIAQGAKPGEGGQLPGTKVYPWIAKVRGTTAGVGLISPPPHHDIYSIEDLAELIHDLKNGNIHARISVKLVSEVGVGTIAAGVAKAHADVILVAGHDGGTGASPLTSIQYAGSPWELGIAETHQTLLLNNLRSRVYLEADGQLKTGRDVAIACLLGAEEFGFATAPLVSLGCIMMRACHKNTCPVGVATQDPQLRAKFSGAADNVVNFMRFVAQELREIMAKLGIRTINEMVGRTEFLEMKRAVTHYKAQGLDYSKIFYQPKVGPDVGRYRQQAQDHGIAKSLDLTKLLSIAKPALEQGERVTATLPILNVHRVVGTILGSEVTRRYGPEGLPEDTVHLHFQGSAGQSFGAFIPRGLKLELEGDANDYFGKGLSGGKLIVYPHKSSIFKPEENVIIGNVAFYGATAGDAYIYGVAGERFAVRNSGVNVVLEGVGDHACEYMTGGRVVILGPSGRNFAAGMSGGTAYVLDEKGDFKNRLNTQMVGLFQLIESKDEEIAEVKGMIERYVQYTGSKHGAEILANWSTYLPKFKKVLPKDYERMLTAIDEMRAKGLTGEDAVMAAFEANAKDAARVGGN